MKGKKKANNKVSVADKIMKVITKNPQTADDIRAELKDRFGYSIKLEDIRVNLLYLLRREKIQRKKDGEVYKYFL